MKQKLGMKQTYKQTFQLNQKMIHSLDFLKLNSEDMQSLIDNALQTNPFLELRKAYDLSLIHILIAVFLKIDFKNDNNLVMTEGGYEDDEDF